jgi:hypothetical protein
MVQRFCEDKELPVDRMKKNNYGTWIVLKLFSKKSLWKSKYFTFAMKRITVRVVNDEIYLCKILSALLHYCEWGQNIVAKERQAAL